MKKHSYKLIVFDWDGTLMDSEAQIISCMQGAIQAQELPACSADAIRNIIGLGLLDAVQQLYPNISEAEHHALCDGYRRHYFSAQRPAANLFHGMQSMLHTLYEQGYLLAVATGKSRRGLDASMLDTGVNPYFHLTRCADESRSKPHPQMLFEIMTSLAVAPEATLMVGDTEYDIQMAHSAGCHALAVGYGVHDKTRLQNCRPHHFLCTPESMQMWLVGQ